MYRNFVKMSFDLTNI